ncbi:hypothetical protein VRU48_03955 [Pedobacter sp. KR3-3]|uniref:Cold-shock protein n=1 Tax=Pedobacter albus TaxID=3113905 RepID=A0ABU7I460_9SPHI|nr:hypothetical protein [Pedobacter sp. KR3-3]MEE1944248.1 hypothetical protein [Pedobacter sp. KR3-3]
MKKQHIKKPKEECLDEDISHVSSPDKPQEDKPVETSGDDEFDKAIDKMFPKKKKSSS